MQRTNFLHVINGDNLKDARMHFVIFNVKVVDKM